jgi:hypothetical protein
MLSLQIFETALSLLHGDEDGQRAPAHAAVIMTQPPSATLKIIAKFYLVFGSTAGSTVCTAPALRTWMVAMSSE